MVNLGYHYETEGHNYEDAVYWYRKAAEKGNPYGQNDLGVCFENGNGVLRNPNAALSWYSKAAEQGHRDAIKNKERLEQSLYQNRAQENVVNSSKDVDFGEDCLWPASYLTLGLLFVYVILALFMDWPTPDSSDGYFTEHNMPFIIIFGVIWVILSIVLYTKEKE